jgi:hypothetical protein
MVHEIAQNLEAMSKMVTRYSKCSSEDDAR